MCIQRGIDRLGFYDTGLCDEPNGQGLGLACDGRLGVSHQRIAYFATASAPFGFENFVWVDLAGGNTSFGPAFDFANGLGFVHVSPSGAEPRAVALACASLGALAWLAWLARRRAR